MAKLINGNGNPAVYAAEDADMLAGIMGNVTTITAVGNEFAATASGANLIEVADGVILTQEGRRIQLDAGITDAFTIPSGTAGTTNYYIIGYRLYESASGTQECETFVQLMASSTDTIPEETFRGGATEVFVSLYRVEQDGVNLGTITSLLPKVSGVSQINSDLSDFKFRNNNGVPEFSIDDGTTWTKMGGNTMQKNYIYTSATPISIDISELSNSTEITFSAYYALANAYSRGSRVTVSTIKGWTSNHKVLNITGDNDNVYALFAKYSNGKLNVWTRADGDSAGACIGTLTIND